MIQLFHLAEDIVQESHDNGKLQKLINQGLDVNQKDEYDISLAERAIFGSINYDALFTLWKAKAIPTTEYVEEIFNEFKNGKTPQEFYQEDEEKEINKKKGVKDFSKNFSAKKLKIASINIEVTEEIEGVQDSEVILNISLKPFIYKDWVTETELQFVGFCNPEMKKQIYSDGYTFKEDEIEPSSIYVQNVHNPIDLKTLKISEGKNHNFIEATLFFDFEYERTDYKNETLHIKYKILKP